MTTDEVISRLKQYAEEVHKEHLKQVPKQEVVDKRSEMLLSRLKDLQERILTNVFLCDS